MAKVNFECSDDLYKEFKIFCTRNELTIKEAFVVAMKILIKKNKKFKIRYWKLKN